MGWHVPAHCTPLKGDQMSYEIIPVANGFLLRIFSLAPAVVGVTTYRLARTLETELVFATFNQVVAELRSRLAPNT